MLLYRILTERVNPGTIENLANKYLDGCTILDGVGLFNNESELSTIIEYSTGTNQDSMIRELANEIRENNQQEAVLVQRLDNIAHMVITG